MHSRCYLFILVTLPALTIFDHGMETERLCKMH